MCRHISHHLPLIAVVALGAAAGELTPAFGPTEVRIFFVSPNCTIALGQMVYASVELCV